MFDHFIKQISLSEPKFENIGIKHDYLQKY